MLPWLEFFIFLSTYIHYLGYSVSVPKKPSSKVGQSVDLIRRVMKSDNCGLHDGCIYKKLEECEYTYIYCTSIKNYLLNLLGNFEIADIIAPHITQLTSLLSKPIKIYFNFVEISNGFCFDIKAKSSSKTQND